MSQNGKCHSLVTQDDPTLPLCFINWLRTTMLRDDLWRRWVVSDEVVNLLGTKAGKIKQAITFADTVFTVIRSAVNKIKFSASVAGGITAPI
ncbi:hypothetical protein CCM_04136 [Cordyceps militaris CM01]|uniref:Uncharacterized protein n=1 Tax=Cordyceps militaris (strain CM01) TaxID=983644 RepID=G3JDT8_CORMM|nr:uncharacterized protein CCM_04136 [Cordyceps militaris CM01]EGX92763.1 hypothetical protein CCM_04136 [Cordyceps militaris CM01]